jgi:hypothetical protein
MSVESDTLARIDQGDKDHERDLAGLKSHWEREDAVTKENRDKTLAAFEQGAKDRAEARKRAKEAMDPPVNAKFTRSEIERLQALLDKEEARKDGPRPTPQMSDSTANEGVPADPVRPRMSSLPAGQYPGTAAVNPTPHEPQLPQRMSSLPPVNWSTPEEANRPDPTKPVVATHTSGVGEEPPKT